MQTINTYLSEVPSSCTTLTDVLRWRAEVQPNREVFTFLLDGETQEVSLTYAELDRRARAIAAQLQSLAAPGDRVLLLLPSDLDYPAAFFGCLYAGVVAVLSSPPRFEKGSSALESIVAVTQPTVALMTTALRSTMDVSLAQVPVLQNLQWMTIDTLPEGVERGWREPVIRDESPAYIMLTSGSTSMPKAIVRSYNNQLKSFTSFQSNLGLTGASRFVSWMPLHNGFPSMVMTIPVYAGIPATLMSPDAFLERPLRWLQAISRFRGTHSLAANFAFDLCTHTISQEERATLDLSSWEVAMNGGEIMRAETVERFAAAFEPCGFRREAFYQAYGMTEAGGIGTGRKGVAPMIRAFQGTALEYNRVIPVSKDERGARLIVSCGPPAANVMIVDPESLVRCQSDQVGEVWFSGPGVAEGYWNQPEETERTFHGSLADTGEGPFVRTGDLGFLHDGEIFLVGRLKELIIIRGRNLSPERIELTVEQSHPALRPASAAAFSIDVDDEERLVIAQEVDPDAQNLAEVIAAIRQAVAEQYEVQPYAVVLIPPGTLPKTASGKLQRQPCRRAFLEDRLEVIERSILERGIRPKLANVYAPPRTPTEQTLAQIWAHSLRVDQVGIDDNFFQLGGDSLTSMQVIARSRQAGLHFTVQQLTEHQTIAELAEVVEIAPTIQAEQGLVTGPAPLLPTQQRFFELQPPESYHHGFYRHITAREHLDPGWLAQAAQHVIAHHDALRMRFFHEEGRWQQFNMEAEEHPLFSYIDLSWMSPEQQEGALMAAGEQLNYTLDLSTGPIVRVTLFDLGPDEPGVVVVVIHHLVTDAFSFRIALEDLETAYRQLSRGEAVHLPPKTTSLKAWAERLAAYAQSPELRNELDYWRSTLPRSIEPLPVDPLSNGRGGGQALWLSAEETKVLVHDVPRVYGTEINDVLLMALVRTFAKWTGSRSLLVDLVSHGRDPIFPDVDLSRTSGWLASFFPMLLDLGETQGLAEELRSIKEQLRRIPTRGLGYNVLRYVSQDQEVVNELRSLPEPQVRFNYVGMFDQDATSTLFSAQEAFARMSIPDERGTLAFGEEGEESELLVTGSLSQGQLRMIFFSGQVVHDPAIMERLAQDYLETLSEIIASCRQEQSVG